MPLLYEDQDEVNRDIVVMYDIIRALYFRVKSAKHVPDKVHALEAFLEQAETLLERHGEIK